MMRCPDAVPEEEAVGAEVPMALMKLPPLSLAPPALDELAMVMWLREAALEPDALAEALEAGVEPLAMMLLVAVFVLVGLLVLLPVLLVPALPLAPALTLPDVDPRVDRESESCVGRCERSR